MCIRDSDKTSTELNERAEHNVDLRVAMTQKVDKNSVSVQQFKIDVVTHEFAGRNKNFYNIYEHGKLIYEDVALFESAMGIVKNLMIGKTEKVNSINKADIAYNNALYEVYMFKSRIKASINEDVMLAKLSQAQNKLSEAKAKILQKL